MRRIASKDAFHRLRTELQLGYVVQCGVRSVNKCRGLSVLIQSVRATPPCGVARPRPRQHGAGSWPQVVWGAGLFLPPCARARVCAWLDAVLRVLLLSAVCARALICGAGCARALPLCGVRSQAVADPEALEGKIEEWVGSFRTRTLATLTQSALDEYKEAIATQLDEPPKTLHQEASGLWPEIVEGTHRWHHLEDLSTAVRRLELAELTRMYDECIAADGPLRRKVSSQWWSQKDDAAASQR